MRIKNPDSERVYVLKDERDLAAPEQSRFFYKLLSYEKFSAAQDSLVEFRQGADDKEQRTVVRSGSQERTILLEGLTRVENVLGEDGKDVAWPADRNGRLKFLTALRPAHRRELAEAILGNSDLTEDAAKNSGSASGSV